MKKTTKTITGFLRLALLALFALPLSCAQKRTAADADDADAAVIAVSLYPVYVAALNVFDGVPGARLKLMDAAKAGCLHNHHLSQNDEALLAKSASLIINGGGMEPFLEQAMYINPDLALIDASTDIDLIMARLDGVDDDLAVATRMAYNLTAERTDGDAPAADAGPAESTASAEENYMFAHHREDHPHRANPHVWLSIENHIKQTLAIAWRQSLLDPDNAAKYNANARAYAARLQQLLTDLRAIAAVGGSGAAVVLEHDGFMYIAQELGLRVAAVVTGAHSAQAVATDIAGVADAVKRERPAAIFTERGRPSTAANAVAAETGVAVIELDMITSGDADKHAYLSAMTQNILAIGDAFTRDR